MKCRLCGNDRELIRAHVIPRSFYRVDPADSNPARLVTNVSGRYTQKIPIGVYDSGIVCEECERRFSPWDDYAAETLLERWNNFEKVEHDGSVIFYGLGAFDYAKLKLFFLSVLWRAAVSTQPMFEHVNLGPREQSLRDSIIRSDPGDFHHFGVLLQAFDDTNVGMLNPHAERFSHVRFIRFYLAHVIAYIKTDSRPLDDPFREHALGATPGLIVLHKNFLTSPERRVMRNLVLADRTKGTRAR